jgi:hypothetical protein
MDAQHGAPRGTVNRSERVTSFSFHGSVAREASGGGYLPK